METPDALLTGAAGMSAQAARLDVISENLANASTTGYRARRWSASQFAGRLASAVALSDNQGALRHTGVATDLALVGPGYFSIATPDGVRYTRDGRMAVNAAGYLCDVRGNKVLGSLGPVQLGSHGAIGSDGRVRGAHSRADRLRIVSLPAGSVSQGPYTAAPTGATITRAPASVQRGYLEESGVDPLVEMTALITAQRAFEANQKSVQRTDESLRRAVTDVPTVRQ